MRRFRFVQDSCRRDDLQDLQVAEEGEESYEGAVQGNGEDVLQVTSRMGAETCDVFEVVFYPALAPHGDDDFGGV